jgi:hypothetical protein
MNGLPWWAWVLLAWIPASLITAAGWAWLMHLDQRLKRRHGL